HLLHCLKDALIFLYRFDPSAHHIADRYRVRIQLERHNSDNDIPVREDTMQEAPPARAVDDQQISYVIHPHELSSLFDGLVRSGGYDVTYANIADWHTICLPHLLIWAIRRPKAPERLGWRFHPHRIPAIAR